ncbi:MAG: cupin domain-containing protein [Acidobacteriota bacterium]
MDSYFSPELLKEIEIPETGMRSRTLFDSADVKVVGLGFAAGHVLATHTAPSPIALYFLEGEGELTIGEARSAVHAGSFATLPALKTHSVAAKTRLAMVLVVMKVKVSVETVTS